MKKTLLCLLFLFSNFFYAQVSDMEHCSGYITFDLTYQKTLLIGNLNPAETTVSYHMSLADATNNANAIVNPTSFVSNAPSKTIYARIDNKGTITINYFNLIVTPYLISTVLIEQISCQNEKGKITVQATGGKGPYIYSINGGTYSANKVFTDLVPGTHTISTKDVLGCETVVSVDILYPLPLIATYTITNVNCYGDLGGLIAINATGGATPYVYSLDGGITYVSTNVFTNIAAGIYNIFIKDANGCFVTYPIFITEPAYLLSTVTIENENSIKISGSGGTLPYAYGISPNYEFSAKNIFSGLEPGEYTCIMQDFMGCYITSNFTINPPPPLINGKNTINVDFTPGQTLGHLVVDGQNLKWYSNPKSLSGKTSKTAETTLPLTTILVHGVTYYASQTINGIESKERLAVTAKLKGSLSTNDFVLPNFKFYPNPVHNILSISNTAVIDEIEIFSLPGKTVLAKKINNLHAEIDLSAVSTGIYFLKVKSEGKIKNIKIVKE